MIKTDTITINGKTFTRTLSDIGMMLHRDGELYEEAIDPVGSGRTYTETDQPIVEEATAEDYQNSLREMGVVL